MLNDDQLLRYSRQIMLPEVDIAGQEAWLKSTVLIIGVGGLGSPVAMYLAAAGVGRLVLVDDDKVELTNLQRQIIHRTETIGQPKVASAKAALAALNPDIQVEAIDGRLEGEALEQQVIAADLVVDCSDNFATRFALNDACVKHKTPLVSGAAIRLEGQVAVFDSRRDDAPCYRCLYRDGDEESLTCADSGVLAPLVGIIGSVQAMEALKVLADIGEPLVGKLLLLDGRHMDWRTLKLRRDPECPCCADNNN
ncbi:molybdopterin-synthase adenylyltransferase MoeB [Amphritea sp. 2_MG-2023]|jgi:adenylyltransferase/sulfurtransferase|uniref:HesA/MoeB/ThiF family protein n=1 Tax=Amphritea TaxID=515417 RepID=UPI001C06A89E|nr:MULTISPECIES: molybdopterin-synthase adenylyltransferase MoeB [Amphritea]MBU2963949.1 molybdopterin-synthase adenylyltransferase MoeB [Amphritea atlantica]MDO6419137.1 molybdopterin-synthase adenylyltransferase MoeB [Amphritea sp. 2_MG-2023]